MAASLRLKPSSRIQPCDLCEGRQFARLAEFDRQRAPLTTAICRQCGLISHETIPTEGELHAYYAVQYRQDYHGEVSPAPHRVVRAWEGGRWLYRLLRPHVPTGCRVGEIGAGIGCTVKTFELAGFEADGIEPGHGFQQFACEQLRARVARASLFDLPAEPTYDFLLLVHVIEHLNSPRKALTHMRHLLRPGGRIYVECPNIAAPHAAPGRQFHFAHIYNFMPETLVRLAESVGFRVAASLARPRERVLRYVFERVETRAPVDFAGGYERACETLRGHHRLGYYLRSDYLWERLDRELRFLSHRWNATGRTRQILAQCQAHAPRNLTAPRWGVPLPSAAPPRPVVSPCPLEP